MNYQRIYDDIIRQAQSRPKPTEYTESHHVIPRSLGGTNEPENLVDLTGREHFLAHYCLWKSAEVGTEARNKMAHAFNCMRLNPNKGGKRYINSRLFANHKEELAKAMSKLHKGKIVSEETRRKLSIAQKGRKLSPERIEQIRITSTGRTHSEETKKKLSEQKREHVVSDETKRKISKNHASKTDPTLIIKSQIFQVGEAIRLNKGWRPTESGRYEVRISIDGKRKVVGYFDTEIEARRVARKFREEHLATLKLRLESLELKKVA